jgi:hypothetical protein
MFLQSLHAASAGIIKQAFRDEIKGVEADLF